MRWWLQDRSESTWVWCIGGCEIDVDRRGSGVLAVMRLVWIGVGLVRWGLRDWRGSAWVL